MAWFCAACHPRIFLYLYSMSIFLPVIVTFFAYLVGSLSFAVMVSRWMGLSDPRTFGSQNPGATNVLRTGSKAAAVLTLMLDVAKGGLPVVLVKWLGQPYGLGDGTVALVGLAVFLGHVYPVFFRFAGGKGVATALGVLLGTSVWLGLATVLIWVVMALVFRYSSLAAVCSAVLSPMVYVLGDGELWIRNKSVTLSIAVMALFLLYRHAPNINRLILGTESCIGKKVTDSAKPSHHRPHREHKPHSNHSGDAP